MTSSYETFSARLAALSLILLASCGLDEPTYYLGNIDGIRFAIPANTVVMSVKYDGEDDWHPPLKPASERTFNDPINLIEFAVTLDDLTKAQFRSAYFGRPPRGANYPGVFGPWIGISVERRMYPGSSIGKEVELWTGGDPVLMPNTRRLPDAFGLRAVAADPAAKLYNPAFDTFYFSFDPQMSLMCGRQRMVVKPFTDISTCSISIPDEFNHVRFIGTTDRINLARWREIRAALPRILAQFRAKPGQSYR